MATTAGGMTTTPGGNPQWRAANGSIISAFQNPLPPPQPVCLQAANIVTVVSR